MMDHNDLEENLMRSCVNEQHDRVYKILKQGANPNSEKCKEISTLKTPLHFACQYGWIGFIQLLINVHKCDTEVQDKMKKTPLHFACQYGWLTVVQMLIELYNCNAKVKDEERKTPLHYACLNKKTEVIKKLIYYSDPNVQDEGQKTPLYYLFRSNHLWNEFHYGDIVKLFISKQVHVNVPIDDDGNTLLHLVCRFGTKFHSLNMVKHLLDIGATCTPNSKNTAGHTPLQVLYSCYYLTIIQEIIMMKLVHAGADPNVIVDSDGNTPLHIACKNGQLDDVKLFLHAKCNPNCKNSIGETPLLVTSTSNPDIIRELILRGADSSIPSPNDGGNTLLHKACLHGHLETVTCLLEADCNPNTINEAGKTPIELTVPEHTGIIRNLVRKGADVNAFSYNGSTLLHEASRFGCLATVKCLLEANCDPNVMNSLGKTPTQVTSIWNIDVIVELVRKGANSKIPIDKDGNVTIYVNCTDEEEHLILMIKKSGKTVSQTPMLVGSWYTDIIRELANVYKDPNLTVDDGNTLLHKACECGHVDPVKGLLAVNCEPNCRNKDGFTPIQVTSIKNSEVIRELIQRGADPNLTGAGDNNGNTLLHLACKGEYLDTVKCLLEAKCNSNSKNNSGQTPLQIVCSYALNKDIINELLFSGADPTVAVDDDGNTLLHMACKRGELEIVTLLLNKDCNVNCTNYNGQTPIQVTSPSSIDIVRELVQRGADPNMHLGDENGNTFLHFACNCEHLSTVKCLLNAKCDPNLKNTAGQSPLQLVPSKRISFKAIPKELIEHGADPDVQVDSDGNTLLHRACKDQNWEAITYLLEADCSLNLKNNAGQTPLQVVPLLGLNFKYIAMVLIRNGADPNVPIVTSDHISSSLTMSLYYYRTCTYLERVKYLFEDNDLSFTEIPYRLVRSVINKMYNIALVQKLPIRDIGNTLLHEACKTGKLETVQILLSKNCDPNHINRAGHTPLQLTFPWNIDIIRELLQSGADPNITGPGDDNGNTLLHVACRSECLDTVKCLLDANCDPNLKNNAGQTPLQLLPSRSIKFSDIPKELIEHGADPNVQIDSDSNTLLHRACLYGQLENISLLLKANCNPNSKNKKGKTPIQLTSSRNVDIIKELIKHGANINDVYNSSYGKELERPLVHPVKVFVVGNPSAGKSTLTAALKTEGTFLTRPFLQFMKVSGVDQKTAGVVPHNFESREYGSVTVYDFAGQKEFYGSHAALMERTITSCLPVFILVVDIRPKCEEIIQTVSYWLSFLENQCFSVDKKPHIIIVGSHADKVNAKGENLDQKMITVQSESLNQFSFFEFIGFIALDCQYPESSGIRTLRQCLKKSCELQRVAENDIAFNSHCLYLFLFEKLKVTTTTLTIAQLQEYIQQYSQYASDHDPIMSFIPTYTHSLHKICEELSDKGHIMFLKDSEDIKNSWIVVDRGALLTEVCGSIFSPKSFDQYKIITQCSCSTGVVPFSSIAEKFPYHNHKLLVSFLVQLEFCHEIADGEIFDLITSEHQKKCALSRTKSTMERYFLVPALVSLGTPEKVWEPKPQYTHHFGWVLRCYNEASKEFFTSRFLQVLLLRLAFSNPLAPKQEEKDKKIPALQRKCSIWKNGIFWGNQQGVETLVEVPSNNKSVVLLMRCPQTSIFHLSKLRSQVIQTILKTAQIHCGRLRVSESLLEPSETAKYPFNLAELKLYSVSDTAKAVLESEPSRAVVCPTGTTPLDNLVLFEPYSGLGMKIMLKIFSCQDRKMPEIISRSFLSSISQLILFNERKELFLKMLFSNEEYSKIQFTSNRIENRVFLVLKKWRDKYNGTYSDLKQLMDRFSIFAGRNPMELAGVQLDAINADELFVDDQTQGELNASSLGKVQHALWEARVQWYNIGLELDITTHTLNVIKEDNREKVDKCFTAMLTEWLETSQCPSWEELVKALNSPTVNLPKVGEEICAKYLNSVSVTDN